MRTHRPKQFRKQHTKQRGTTAQRGYGYRWQQYRIHYLQANPLCVHCERKEAKHVDHKVAVSGADDPLFWEQSNHQALCPSCHSRKTIRVDGGFGR